MMKQLLTRIIALTTTVSSLVEITARRERSASADHQRPRNLSPTRTPRARSSIQRSRSPTLRGRSPIGWYLSRGTWLPWWHRSLLTHSAWDDVTSTVAGQQTAAARVSCHPRAGLIQTLPPNCNHLHIMLLLCCNIRIVLRDFFSCGRGR